MYKYNTTNEKEFKRNGTFKRKPKGIIIFDSYNNKWFPLETVKVDSVMFNTRTIRDEFHRNYGGNSKTEIFTPWHYSIEFVGKNYYCLQSRPITYKSLIPEYEDYITICIVGDSNADIYSPEIYKTIAHTIINPLHYLIGWHIKPDDTLYHNLGKNFKIHQLQNFFR
ncbi:MAG: hypothetical protein WC136_08355 [Sphaerochaeta sp.]|jgi:hypothetical protein